MNARSILYMVLVVGLRRTQAFASFGRHRIMSTRLASKSEDAKLVQDMLYRIRQVNQAPPITCINFSVDGVLLGKVSPTMVEILAETSVFEVHDNTLTLSAAAGTNCESRTQAVQSVMQILREKGLVTGWRDELYPISKDFYQDPMFLMERAAVPVLGGLEYGVHLNGLIRKEDGSDAMWIARRSASKSKYPGMLDHMVAGGQPAGLSLMDNAIKECEEEAGIPQELTRAGIQPTGAISYEMYDNDRVSRAVLFCYDLQLPQDFLPQPVDGEVDDFFLWDMAQIKESFHPDYPDPIKPNCYPVIIHYLLRKGHISPDTPGYLDVLRELRGGECR